MRILVDMDGVICGWGDEWDLRVKDLYHLGLRPTNEQEDFDLTKHITTPEGMEAFLSIMNAEDFYKVLKPIPGAREALNEMVAEGHDVRIVTSPWLSNPTCAADKIAWVEKHIGEGWAQRVVITRDKSVVLGDVIIDDKPHLDNADQAVWRHIYFTQNYNKDLPGPRISDWSHWREVIAEAMAQPHASDVKHWRELAWQYYEELKAAKA